MAGVGEREDFQKALKTGCRMERHNVQSMDAMWRLLAVLTPIALRLLVIRQTAQQAPDTPATDVASQELIQVVTLLDIRHRAIATARHLWHAIARLGGYLAPFERWSTRMADLMERMDAGHGHLGGRSSCRSAPSFLICV
jgi:hypothetical protein